MKIAILRSELLDSGDGWMAACKRLNIEAEIIDLCSAYSLDQISKGGFDLCLLKPPGDHEVYKTIYDEKLYHIRNILQIPCFPSFFECFIYENKKSLAAFLQAVNLPHPQTWVLGHKEEAYEFIGKTKYPIVAKTSIGAAGSGVLIIRDKKQAKKYLNKAFGGSGIRKRVGPNPHKGNIKTWTGKAIVDPKYFLSKLKQYRRTYYETQRSYVIFQEYVEHDYEWRIIKVGDSYFGYKKYKVGDKASGTDKLGFENPPLELLNFTHQVAEKYKINTAAFDYLTNNDNFYINEIQTYFGHSEEHILEVNGKPGRYVFNDDNWVFEEAPSDFDTIYDLRVQTAVELLRANKL